MGICSDMSANKMQKWGDHNKSACEHLAKVTDFPDWIITTAFYAAIHYVDSKVFPLTIDGRQKITFSCLESYYNYQRNYDTQMPSKHEFRLDIAQAHLDPEILARFKRLYDASFTARYRDYQELDFKKAQGFYEDLCKIKEYCS